MTMRILLPVDEREGSIRTSNYFIRMKDRFNPVINLITVYDDTQLQGHGLLGDVEEKIRQTADKIGEKLLNNYRTKLENAGIFIENAYMVSGAPGESICKESDKLNVDMIAISPSNNSNLMNCILGSVTHYVIHNASMPVILIR